MDMQHLLLFVFVTISALQLSGAQDGQDNDIWRWCYDRCVSEWQPWSACDALCGVGRVTRSRTKIGLAPCRSLNSFSCPHHLVENKACSPGCPFGGFPAQNLCQFCPGGKTGQCCQTVSSCPDPGQPVNGYRVGQNFNIGIQVTFRCRRGYELTGEKTLKCQSNGKWSGSLPICEACPVDFYSQNEKCVNCPANTHTTSQASTSIYMCLCDQVKGFFGPAGGPCREARCPILAPPFNGAISECGNKLGNSCEFSCNDGYVITRGAEKRTCHANALWTGSSVNCDPCPQNTYKVSDRSCFPCPQHSGTYSDGQMKQGCVCDKGFQGPPGGPCVDIDECVTNDGKGPCSDTCSNTVGSFSCGCTIPGYGLDPNDNLNCIVLQTCRNLTRDDAPENGGLVCRWYLKGNSQECEIKCNPGYHVSSNAVKSCGPHTGYVWTPVAGKIGQCTRVQLQPEPSTEKPCKDLTDESLTALKEDYARVLNSKGICRGGNCDVRGVSIVCGSSPREN